MRVLQICKKPPLPARDGEALAILNLTKLLVAQKAKVTLLAIVTPKHNNTISQLQKPLIKNVDYQQCFVNTNFSLTGLVSTFFKNKSYALQRFYCKKFEALIIETLTAYKFDIVQLEGLYLTPYLSAIKKHSKAKIVLRAHNVEHQLWLKLAENTSNFFRRILYKRNAHELEKAEIKSIISLDAIVSISTADQKYFQQHKNPKPVLNLPFGIDVNNYNIQKKTSPKTIAFIGSLDWLPNLEGLHWFINEVFPVVLKQFSEVKFFVAGRNLKDAQQFQQNKSVHIIGEVEDAKAFIATHPVFVVPLLSGSGMRIKIIEAMALKRAVVSTKLGAAGINFTNNKDIAIADSATNFANTIINLLRSHSDAINMGENAYELVADQYNNDILADKLIQFYNSLLL